MTKDELKALTPWALSVYKHRKFIKCYAWISLALWGVVMVEFILLLLK